MSKGLQNIKEIDEYLSGELSPEQLIQFEKRLQMDIDLQEQVNTVKQIIEGIQGYAFKKMLSDLHMEYLAKNSES